MQENLSKRRSISGLAVPVNSLNHGFISVPLSVCDIYSFHLLKASFLSTILSFFFPPISSPFTSAHQHCLSSSLKLSGQLSGTGSCRLLLPTPQMIAEESTSLYGTSPVNISHSTTPNDLQRYEPCFFPPDIWIKI